MYRTYTIMKLRSPPSLEVLRALTIISNGRVKVEEANRGIVNGEHESFEVYWDWANNKVKCGDELTKQGIAGFPVISFLMLQGILPYEPYLATKLKEVDWKRMEEIYSDENIVIARVTAKWSSIDKEKLKRFLNWIKVMFDDLDIEIGETPKTISDFVKV